MSKNSKPFLKWAGNKFGCLTHLQPLFPKANRLIEPFVGSGALFMNTDYPQYVLAESNNDLILLFQLVQREGLAFIDYCASFFSENNNTEEQYYKYREQFNQETDLHKRAALFLYLNRHNYRGLCRYNQNGKFNVPFGGYPKSPCFPRAEMLAFHQKSKLATFIHRDFRDTFALVQSDDLVYCDPPYAPLPDSTGFTAYTGTRFTEQDQIELANSAKDAANKGSTVIISNHDTSFIRQIYSGSEITSFPVRRGITGPVKGRGKVQELLAVFKAQSFN